mmetsp:Transcript_121033/g.349692  ORF Transcript_121033/g.349692 Transcript_121033/m.349692 type:complete len:285 (-) Transcript_121033:168-1022(-)
MRRRSLRELRHVGVDRSEVGVQQALHQPHEVGKVDGPWVVLARDDLSPHLPQLSEKAVAQRRDAVQQLPDLVERQPVALRLVGLDEDVAEVANLLWHKAALLHGRALALEGLRPAEVEELAHQAQVVEEVDAAVAARVRSSDDLQQARPRLLRRGQLREQVLAQPAKLRLPDVTLAVRVAAPEGLAVALDFARPESRVQAVARPDRLAMPERPADGAWLRDRLRGQLRVLIAAAEESQQGLLLLRRGRSRQQVLQRRQAQEPSAHLQDFPLLELPHEFPELRHR